MNIWLVDEREKTKMIAEKYNLKCFLILIRPEKFTCTDKDCLSPRSG